MKKYIGYALALATIIIFTLAVFDFEKQEEEQVIKVFAEGNFVNMSSSVECVIGYGSGNLKKKQKKEVLAKFANELGIQDGYKYKNEKNKSGTVLTLSRIGGHSKVYLKMLTVKEDKNCENYLMVNIILENSIDSALYYKEKMAEILSKYEENPKIMVNLAGMLPGKLSRSQRNDVAQNLLNNTQSKVVIDGRDEDIYTIYAYTGKVKEYITVGGDKVNLNIAITYDEKANQSKVYLSTPIINLDY